MWHPQFDKIFLINLPDRTDRLQQATEELNKHKIPFELWSATKDENGAYGLWLTMKSLFEYCNQFGYHKILVFEDDIQFTNKYSDLLMEECLRELNKQDWDLFYLGANVNAPLISEGLTYLLRCTSMLSTHAVGYSKSGQQLILDEMKKGIRRVQHHVEPIDQLYERVVQLRGKSYISNDLLAVQRPSYSDILKMDIDWAPRIQDTFCKRVKEMKKL